MSDRHFQDQRPDAEMFKRFGHPIRTPTPEHPREPHQTRPPLPAPKLMRLHVYGAEGLHSSYDDVVGSSLVGPSTFRFEMLDGRIVLMDMSGRDFVLKPQVSS